jgi:hypothetical protein
LVLKNFFMSAALMPMSVMICVSGRGRRARGGIRRGGGRVVQNAKPGHTTSYMGWCSAGGCYKVRPCFVKRKDEKREKRETRTLESTSVQRRKVEKRVTTNLVVQ